MDEEKAEKDPQEQVDTMPEGSVETTEEPTEAREAAAQEPPAADEAAAEPEGLGAAEPTDEPAAEGAETAEAEAAAEGEEPAEGEEAEAEEEKHPGFTSTVEETGPCARLLRIEVTQERVTEEIDNSYDELRRTVFIKGFRPGHVPRHILERRFGDDVLGGVKEALMDEGYQAALEEHHLTPAVPPEILEEKEEEAAEPATEGDEQAAQGQETAEEPTDEEEEKPAEEEEEKKPALDPSEPFRFEVKVEVAPEFTIDNYKGVVVERPSVAVSEADVGQALEGFRMRQGEFEVVEDASIEETDVPVVHVVALVEGEERWRRDELGAHIGDETVGGLSVPGLRDAFLGARVGESRTLKVTLPEAFPEEELRGQEVDLEVTVDEVRRFTAPEATDAWAEGLDFEDLEDLREELEDELRLEREREADEAVHGGIDGQLVELTSFDVPDGLVERMVESQKERQRMALLYRGVGEEEIDKLVGEQEQRTREQSVRQCKLYFIYRQIAEQEKLFVTEGEMEQRVQAIALNYQRRPDEVRAELEESGQLGSLRQQMREEKVRDFLVQHAEVHDAGAPAAPGPAEGQEAAAETPDETPEPEREATEAPNEDVSADDESQP